jgi:hypothetical protein
MPDNPSRPAPDHFKMTLQRRSLLTLAAGALGPSGTLLSTGARAADGYPNRPLRWIVA